MRSESPHVRDEIEELLDGRLDDAARQRVETHLARCEECESVRRALLLGRESLRTGVRHESMPEDLTAAVIAVLDREDRRSEGPRAAAQNRRLRLYIAAAAAVVLVALAVFLTRPRDLPALVAENYSEFRAGRLPLDLETADAVALERFFADRGVRFRTRVLDLAMMRYQLLGGAVLDDGARKRAFFVYRGEDGRLLACQMYEGRVSDLRAPKTVRRHGDFTFLVFRANDQTQVFWQEGDVVCVLTSDIPSEEVVQLAFAKAMQPPAPPG
jgi:anti-sigma factor RsiW